MEADVSTQLGHRAPKLERKHLWWLAAGLALLVLLAYGQTLGMYFWQDDAALIFKMQHPIPNSGSFGSGIFGVGAYKYLATPFIPLYPLFGMNPLPYFALGLFIYLVLTYIVFWFIRVLTQNNRVATTGAVLFGAGYFSQLAIFRLINSYQTNMSVMLALATFGVLILFYQTRKWWWYALAVLLFGATLELMLVRSHGLIIPFVALEGLFLVSTLDSRLWTLGPKVESRKSKVGSTWSNVKGQLSNVALAALRLLPFVLIYKAFYFNGNESSGGALDSLMKTYLVEGHWENFFGLAASFGNMLIPDVIIKWFSELSGTPIGPTNWSHLLVFGAFLLLVWLTKWRLKLSWRFSVPAELLGAGWLWINILGAQAQYLWYQDFTNILSGTIGGLALVYFGSLALNIWNRYRLLSIAILFSLVWSVANYFGYFVLYPTSIMTSTTRYVMHSFVATVALWAIWIELLFAPVRNAAEKDRSDSPSWLPTAIVTALLALVPLSLTIGDQQAWVAEKSVPTRAFYQTMQQLYPKLEYGALIWYDTKRDPAVEYAFGDFFAVGSMPDETALAIYYGIDRYDLKLSNGANNFLGEAYHWKKAPEQLYTFYYDGTELHDTTSQTRSALAGERPSVSVVFDGPTGTPAEVVGTSTPVLLDLDLTAEVKPADQLASSGTWVGPVAELPTYYQYLEARDALRRSLQVTVSSEWSGAEKEYLADGNYEKGWASHRTIWPVEGEAVATVELPQAMSLNRVIWTNSHIIRTPTSYTIDVSSDGTTWRTVKEVADAPERPTAETVAEDFEAVTARFVRMRITKSATGEAPGLIEFEVVPSQFGRLDPMLAAQLSADPLLGAPPSAGGFGSAQQDDAVRRELVEFLESHRSIGVQYQTDRAAFVGHDPITIKLDDRTHYQLVLPASGTNLEKIQLVVPSYLAGVTIKSATVSFPTLDELNNLGFIERRSIN